VNFHRAVFHRSVLECLQSWGSRVSTGIPPFAETSVYLLLPVDPLQPWRGWINPFAARYSASSLRVGRVLGGRIRTFTFVVPATCRFAALVFLHAVSNLRRSSWTSGPQQRVVWTPACRFRGVLLSSVEHRAKLSALPDRPFHWRRPQNTNFKPN